MRTKKYNPLQDYERLSPHRSPRWRYERLSELLETSRHPNPAQDDPYIVEAYKFLREWNRAVNATDENEVVSRKRRLFAKWPGLYFAYETFILPDAKWTSVLIEARILAAQNNEEISDRICIIPEAVEWYERLFFNVRDRLRYSDYISKRVIGPIVAIGLQNMPMEVTAKYFGYFAGPTVLDMIVDGFKSGESHPGKTEDLRSFFEKYVTTNFGARMATATLPVEINKFNFEHLLDTYAKVVDMGRRAQVELGIKTNLEENISVLLTSVPWVVGEKRQELIKQSNLSNYLGHAVEPRAADLLRIASGEDPPHLAGIESRALPPPPVKEEKSDEDNG